MALWGWSEEVWGKLAAFGLLLALLVSGTLALRPSLLPGSESPGAVVTHAAAPPLYQAELAVLTRQGIPPRQAARQLELQGDVAGAELVQKLEAALGRDYAGVWYQPDAALLHVGVTSAAARTAAEALAAKEGLAARVAETPVGSTWGQLEAEQERWNHALPGRLGLPDSRTALGAEADSVFVTVANSVPPRKLALLERKAENSPVNVNLKTAPGSTIGKSGEAETKCLEFAPNEAFCGSPLTAGVRIQSAGGGICTAGPIALDAATKTETYVMTAGHCVKETGGVGVTWNAFPKAGEPKKIGTAKSEVFGVAGDYGKIQIEAGSFWTTGKAEVPAFAVTARWSKKEGKSYPVVGEEAPVEKAAICHEGQTTGEKCGVIKKLNACEKVSGTTIGGMVEHSAESAPGDSGGIYISINKVGEIFALGTHITTEDFQPIGPALAAMGLELLTTKNEKRP
jgi:streptogrisin C